jgi:hypothetical protein
MNVKVLFGCSNIAPSFACELGNEFRNGRGTECVMDWTLPEETYVVIYPLLK